MRGLTSAIGGYWRNAEVTCAPDVREPGFPVSKRIEAWRAFFDWDGDGYVERTGWAAADDGVLVYDHDGDGKVTQADEISFVGYVTGAKTDLEGLRFFDTNQDGRLDAADAEAAKFKVWQDRDQDGDVDAGEMESLTEAGIAAIGLHGTKVDRTEDGNTVFNEATFTRSDGATSAVGDAAFGYRRGATASQPGEADPAGDAALDRLIQAMAMFGADGDRFGDVAPVPVIDPALDGADSPPGFRRGQPAGAHVPPGAQDTGGERSLPAGRPVTVSLPYRPTD